MKTLAISEVVRNAWRRAPVSCIISSVGFFGLIVQLIGGWRVAGWFGLHATDLSSPLHWFRFVTYAILHGSVIHWAWNSALFISIGFAIEKRILKTHLLAVIATSSLLGSVIYCLIVGSGAVLIGSGLILHGCIGCLFASFVMDRANFSRAELILTMVLLALKIVSLANGLLRITDGMNMNILQWIIIIVAFFMSKRVFNRYKQGVNIRFQPDAATRRG